jgi:hypothetical protein
LPPHEGVTFGEVGTGVSAVESGGTKLEPEDVFREANERIAESARELGFQSRVPFLCECSDKRCRAFIKLTLEEYEEARSDPHRYLTISGHEVLGALVIARDERFALAEKL